MFKNVSNGEHFYRNNNPEVMEDMNRKPKAKAKQWLCQWIAQRSSECFKDFY